MHPKLRATTAISAIPPYAAAAAPDPLTERARAVWTSGDFGRIAAGYAAGAAEFIARLALAPGERVLDAACGTGNLALPAARAGAEVTGLDIAANLIEQAREGAAAEDLESARFDVGDVESMPYGDASFDSAVTMFGAMFAPRPERAAAELLRVVRAGGRIAMANWTPTGFIGQMFRLTASYVTPAQGVPSPILWGNAEMVRERLGHGTSEMHFAQRLMVFEYPISPAETADLFRAWYGPTIKAFAAVDEGRREAFRADLVALWSEHNLATDGSTRVESEYLEVVAVVR